MARQIELARAFAERQGWTVSPEHVYLDDGISGGEFDPKKRPGLAALLAAARSRPRPFDLLVTMSQSRLARRMRYAVDIVHDLADDGVRIFFYQTGMERKLDTATERFMVGVDGFSDEAYRENCRMTTRETMFRKAERGEVAGGKVYSFRNVRLAGHVEREPVADEAGIIRRIFTEAAAGRGFARIAKTLNAERIPSPRARRGWATTAVRESCSETCTGAVSCTARHDGRTVATEGEGPLPESEWVVLEAPALRIVPDELWRAAHARLEQTRAVYRGGARGALWGRPTAASVHGHGASYLLSGLMLCGCCGYGFHAITRTSRRGPVVRYYVCTTNRTRGETVCTNGRSAPMDALHSDVIETIRRDVLAPDLVRDVLRTALELGAKRPTKDHRKALEDELARLQGELARYADASIGISGPLPSILEALRARERRREEICGQLAALTATERRPAITDSELYRRLSGKLTDWQDSS